MRTYDVIVLGAGGVGSAAMYHVARRGLRVAGIDRFTPAHDRGSSHGRTRIIRQAYFEHPDYVPLLLRAYELWRQLSQQVGKELYHEVGLLQVGHAGGAVLAGVRQAAALHGLPIESFNAETAQAAFPAFRLNAEWEAVFERKAGYLDVEDCVQAHLTEAKRFGAELFNNTTVHGWRALGDERVVVETDAGEFHAARLIVAAGAWAGEVLSDLGVRFRVLRKSLFWYDSDNQQMLPEHGCPTFLFETPSGTFYGFPRIDEWGVKVAEHSGGKPVANPLEVDRDLDLAEQSRVETFASGHLPGIGRKLLHHDVCMYTMSPDTHFVLDRHPQFPQVSLAAGLSGHGFKFTSVLGEALADLAVDGQTRLPIGFLNCRRAGIVEV